MLCPNTIRKNKQSQETFLGSESTFLGMQTTFLGSNLKKSAFLEAGSWVGVFSVFSRSSLGVLRQGIREGKETAILINVLFSISEFFGSSLVLPWFILGLWHGIYREDKTERNLKKSTFAYTHILGGRAYPVRHYPVAIRLRDRKGHAILCSHYFLSVGTLRVLHSECVPSHSFT